MATTTNGLPYPVGTDLLTGGDDAIKALADALELRGSGLYVQQGRSDLAVTNGDVRITFPKAFASTPSTFQVCAAELTGYVPLFGINWDGGGLTVSSCQLTVFSVTTASGGTIARWGGTLPMFWLAIGKGPLV